MHAVAILIIVLSSLILHPVHCPHLDNRLTVSQCNNSPLVKIFYDLDNLEHLNWTNTQIKTTIAYGTSVDVWCGSRTNNADKLIMTRNGEKLVTKKTYINVIAWTKKLDVLRSEYVMCTDIESNCTRSVIMSVTPRFEVISSNAQEFVNDSGTNYAVQYGESMSVLCSGPDAASLIMTHDGNILPTKRESYTTIKFFVKKPDRLTSEYVCSDTSSTYNGSVVIKVIPRMYLQSGNEIIMPLYVHRGIQMYFFEYRKSVVEAYCSGLRAVKLISDGDYNFTENVMYENENTVKLVKKIDTETFNFKCSDIKFSDYVNTAQVRVLPSMEVSVSSKVRRVGVRDDMIQYQLKYGDPLEIICSCTDSDKLNIHNYAKGLIGSEKEGVQLMLNETAIRFVLKDTGMDQRIIFYCSTETSASSSILVGVLPADVTDFSCVSHNGQYLNCSWTAPSNKVNYTLSFVENEIITRICDMMESSRRSKFCVWDYEFDNEHKDMKVLNMLLQSCNDVDCSNQTFRIDHVSVVKPAPPGNLKVLSTTPRGAVLKWYSHSINVAGEYFANHKSDFHHKMQYWYSGIESREVNSSLVICADIFYCKIELDLPCPGQFYEVFVQQKLKRTVGQEFWSDPGSVTFHTAVDDNETDDPNCSWKPRKTPEVMKYLVQELKENVHLDIRKFKSEVSALKNKLANIRAYLEQQGKRIP